MTGYKIVVDNEMIYKTATQFNISDSIPAGDVVHEIYCWDNGVAKGWYGPSRFFNVHQEDKALYVKRELLTEEVIGCVIQEPGHWEAASCGGCGVLHWKCK